MISILVILSIIAAIGLYIMNLYNNLVALKNGYLNAFSQIQVQLKRRYDLIPSLVKTAKAYMEHESTTLQNVTDARNKAKQSLQKAMPEDAQAIKELISSESELNKQISGFNITLEAYPELKANENMMQLSEELTSTENKVSFARQAYNDAVMEYNTARQSMPTALFTNFFGHTKDANLLEFSDSEQIQEPPKVEF